MDICSVRMTDLMLPIAAALLPAPPPGETIGEAPGPPAGPATLPGSFIGGAAPGGPPGIAPGGPPAPPPGMGIGGIAICEPYEMKRTPAKPGGARDGVRG